MILRLERPVDGALVRNIQQTRALLFTQHAGQFDFAIDIIEPTYTANFVFVFKSQVPNELIPINPLGLAITYFREDEAFK